MAEVYLCSFRCKRQGQSASVQFLLLVLTNLQGAQDYAKGKFKRSIYAGCQEGLGMSQSGYVSFASKALIHQGYFDLLECCIPSALSMSISPCNIAAFPQLFQCQFPPCNITQDSFLEFKLEVRYKQNKKN